MAELHVYPNGVGLARDESEVDDFLRDDLTAFSAICATWGRMGGLETLRRYGREHVRCMALIRWGKISAARSAS